MADYIRPTPRNPFLGGLADLLEASTSPERTQQMQGIMSMLGVPAVASTLNRMSYGAPLTSGAGGLGGTTRILPDVLEAAMTVAPMAPVAGKAAKATAKALGPTAAGMAEGYLQRQGLMAGIVPTGGKAASKIDEITGLPLNPDGTVTLFHHTNKTAAEQIAKSGRLKSAGEPSVYLTTQKATDTGYGDVAVPVRVKPSMLNLDDQFPSGRMDFSIDTGKPKGSVPVTVEKQSFQYPQDEAMRLAQQRAALPVEQGGLGLPAGNTAEQRAKAMGFDVNNPQYHATDVDYESIRPSRTGKMGAGVYMSPSSKYAEKYVGENSRVLPLVTRGQFANKDVAMDIAESIRQKMASQNPDFSVPEWKRQTTQGISDAGYAGQSFSGLESVVTNPENIRSRFAAFDPFRRTAAIAATMGAAAPDLLAAQEDEAMRQRQLGLIGTLAP